MKTGLPYCLIIIFSGFFSFSALAQQDNFRLVCPLNEAVVVPPPKNAMRYDPPDLCIVLTSIPDTIVKAAYAARVTNTEMDEEGKYGVVLFVKHNNKEYYFWYTGLSKLTVKRFDNLKAGQPLGFIRPGDRIEMLMYDFETPVDPIKYLDCKGVLQNN
jgi:hypothetical protein